MNPPLVIIGTGCLVCLLPLALYCLFLAFLNGRRHPTRISGPWDFAGLLLGLSGFLLAGAVLLLTLFDSGFRTVWLRGNPDKVRAAWHAGGEAWSIVCGAYLVILVGGVGLLLFLRRRVTAIYNVEPAALEDALARVLDDMNLHWRKRYGGFEVGPRRADLVSAAVDATTNHAGPPKPNGSGRSHPAAGLGSPAGARIEIDSFPLTKHVTLRWQDADPRFRRAVEAELDRALEQTESPPNPSVGWFLTAASCFFVVMLLSMVLLVYWLVTSPRAL